MNQLTKESYDRDARSCVQASWLNSRLPPSPDREVPVGLLWVSCAGPSNGIGNLIGGVFGGLGLETTRNDLGLNGHSQKALKDGAILLIHNMMFDLGNYVVPANSLEVQGRIGLQRREYSGNDREFNGSTWAFLDARGIPDDLPVPLCVKPEAGWLRPGDIPDWWCARPQGASNWSAETERRSNYLDAIVNRIRAEGFHGPAGVATDGTNVFVADSDNHTIRRIVIATGVVTTLAGTASSSGFVDGTGAAARFFRPTGIVADGTNLFVADTGNRAIRQIVIRTGAVTTLAGRAGSSGSAVGTGAAPQFWMLSGVATDGTNVFVADTDRKTIQRIVIASGAVTTLAGRAGSIGSADGTGAAAGFWMPSGVATDGTNIFVADSRNYTIRRIVIATGGVTTLAGTALSSGFADGTGATARFNGPTGVATDGTNVFVADSDNHTIRRIVIATGVVTTLAGTASSSGFVDGTGAAARFFRPTGIVADGTNLFVADTGNSTIRRIVIRTGAVTTLAGSPGAWGNTKE